jgi:YgiT-type zinc finger domain-containing protein
MKCTTCGSELQSVATDLPFKVADHSIVVIKGIPVLQCAACPEYVLLDSVMASVDVILGRVDHTTELEIVRFAA